MFGFCDSGLAANVNNIVKMKKRSSLVWRYFDRLEENKRCVGVLCKLCDTQYKFFGNTTNMRAHLTCKHPLQWELGQSGNLDESTLRYEEDNEQPTVSVGHGNRKKYKDKNVRYSVSVDLNNESNISGEESMPQIEIQRVYIVVMFRLCSLISSVYDSNNRFSLVQGYRVVMR